MGTMSFALWLLGAPLCELCTNLSFIARTLINSRPLASALSELLIQRNLRQNLVKLVGGLPTLGSEVGNLVV